MLRSAAAAIPTCPVHVILKSQHGRSEGMRGLRSPAVSALTCNRHATLACNTGLSPLVQHTYLHYGIAYGTVCVDESKPKRFSAHAR